MPDYDLSDLLQEAPVPKDGASRVRQTAKRRRRHSALGACCSILFLAGVATGIVLTDRDPDSVDIRDAGHTTVTEPPATTSTTSTTLGPRERYVGIVHTASGNGLPVGTRVLASGVLGSNAIESEARVGDKLAYWVRDERGDMVWINQVTKVATAPDYLTSSKVLAVFDVPTLKEQQIVCMHSCAIKSTNVADPSLVAVFDIDGAGNATGPLRAWKVDAKALKLTTTSSKDIIPWSNVSGSQNAYETPPRPELYKTVANCKLEEECNWYRETEQVSVSGVGQSVPAYSFSFLLDRKEGKNVLVVKDASGAAVDMVIAQASLGDMQAGDSAAFSVKDKPNAIVAVTAKTDAGKLTVTKAWMFDVAALRFTEIPAADVKAL